MKPAMIAGTFMAFHCLTRMPLWGMSNTGRITWAPVILAFIRAGAKSLAPVGKVSWPTTFHFSLPSKILVMMSAVARAQATSWFMMNTLLKPNSLPKKPMTPAM